MAMYGMAPLAGLDGGGFMADLVLGAVRRCDAGAVPDGVDPVAIASMSDNIPDGWRAVGPYRADLAALDPADRRVLVVGRLSIGLYAAAFGVGVWRTGRLRRHRPQRLAMAEKLGARVHDRAEARQVLGSLPGHGAHLGGSGGLAATIRATWPDGVCTDTGIYYQGGVEMPLLSMYTRGLRFVTGRVNARAVIPEILELITAPCDLTPAVDRVVRGRTRRRRGRR